MTAGREVETHEGLARLHQGQEHRLVGLTAGVRLDVGEAAAEQFGDPLDGEGFGDVDELAAAVVAPARVALRIFVRHHRALRFEHGAGDDVLGGDQFDLVALTAEFEFDRVRDLGIGSLQVGAEEAVGQGVRSRAVGGGRHRNGGHRYSRTMGCGPRASLSPREEGDGAARS